MTINQPNRESLILKFLVFLNEIAQSIVQLPFLNVLGEGKLIWKFRQNGFYNVKSACHSIMNMNFLLNNDHLKVESHWSLVWKLKVQPIQKSSNLLRDCLPTQNNLIKKMLIVLMVVFFVLSIVRMSDPKSTTNLDCCWPWVPYSATCS